jgi:Cell division protein CrgA
MATKAKTGPGKSSKKGSGRATPRQTKGVRYTPPVSKKVKTSPRWLGLLILAFFLIGVVLVILNYAGLLPGGVNNLWLIGAIGSIFVGLLLATRYR